MMDFVAGFVLGMLAMFFISALLGGDSEPPETILDDLDADEAEALAPYSDPRA